MNLLLYTQLRASKAYGTNPYRNYQLSLLSYTRSRIRKTLKQSIVYRNYQLSLLSYTRSRIRKTVKQSIVSLIVPAA